MRQTRIEVAFAKHFQEALRGRFGRLPSAAFTALQFNRRLENGDSISDETMRRWMRGCSMPTYQHLTSLCAWLELDINALVHPEKPGPRLHQPAVGGPPTSAPQLSNRLIDLVLNLEPELQECLAMFLGSFASSHPTQAGSYRLSRCVASIPTRRIVRSLQTPLKASKFRLME